ncbi:MAG: sigma-70 region 4 domain-containing protein, partial [Chitinophaga rupis]
FSEIRESQDVYTVDPEALTRLNEEELLQLINQLPEGYRVVFNLYVLEGYSHDEIAELLGIKPATSRSQLAKARRMLQEQITPQPKIDK